MAYELVSDLIKAFREDERDQVAPFFWSDNQLVRFINEALSEFAAKTRSIYDDSSAVTELPYSADQRSVPLPSCIIDVVDAWYDGNPPRYLNRIPFMAYGNGWRGGYWNAYTGCTDFRFNPAGEIALYPTPQADGVIRLLVVRKPIKEVDKPDRVPDLLPDHRRHLLHYMKHRAYRVADAEIFDPSKAINFLAEFDAACQEVLEDSILRRGDCSRPIRGCW
jgi:hypothetical protein